MIYFIQAGGPKGAIKIGSSQDVDSRLRALQPWCPLKLKVLGVLKGGVKKERKLHKRFLAEHIHHEWFRPSARLTAFISDRCSPDWERPAKASGKHFFNLYLRDGQLEYLKQQSSRLKVSVAQIMRWHIDVALGYITPEAFARNMLGPTVCEADIRLATDAAKLGKQVFDSGAEVLAFKAVTSSGEVYLGRAF